MLSSLKLNLAFQRLTNVSSLAPSGAAQCGSRPTGACGTQEWRDPEWSPHQLRHMDEFDLKRSGADQSGR